MRLTFHHALLLALVLCLLGRDASGASGGAAAEGGIAVARALGGLLRSPGDEWWRPLQAWGCSGWVGSLWAGAQRLRQRSRERGQCRAWCGSAAFKSAEQQADDCVETCTAFPAVTTFPEALAHTPGAPGGPSYSSESSSSQPQSAAERTVYAAFYAEGERGSEGYDTYHMTEPSTDYLRVLRVTDPSAEAWVLTDQATPLRLPPGVRLFRHPMDRVRLGRNAWSNFYQFEAQAAFLRHLDTEAARTGEPPPNVVFADMDAFILRPLTEVFRPLGDGIPLGDGHPLGDGRPMDLAFTLSDTEQMPVNIGLQFVPGGAYGRAAALYDALLAGYDTTGPFVQGQLTVARYLGLLGNRTAVLGRLLEAVQEGRSCREVPLGAEGVPLGDGGASSSGSSGGSAVGAARGQRLGGSHSVVCLLPCHRYNHCHAGSTSCCTGMGPGRLPFSPQAPAELAGLGVDVLHMVGFRKPGLPHLRAAFERGERTGSGGGKPALLEAFSRLPHGEAAWGGWQAPSVE